MGAPCDVCVAILFAMSAKEDLMRNVWYLYASMHLFYAVLFFFSFFIVLRILSLSFSASCSFVCSTTVFQSILIKTISQSTVICRWFRRLSIRFRVANDAQCHVFSSIHIRHVDFTLVTNFCFFCRSKYWITSLISQCNERWNYIVFFFIFRQPNHLIRKWRTPQQQQKRIGTLPFRISPV